MILSLREDAKPFWFDWVESDIIDKTIISRRRDFVDREKRPGRHGGLMEFQQKKSKTPPPLDVPASVWPVWARWVVSVMLVIHVAALLAGALAAGEPASDLERRIADRFVSYHQVIDQGYTYRYYAPEPGPTPVVTARVHYADGRPDEELRLPERGTWPRLRYQRQLALANHLFTDFAQARQITGDGQNSKWGQSYARHIASSRPRALTVTLYLRMHLSPELERVRQEGAGTKIDLDAEEFYTTPERIGEYACAGF
jgi:hypothetical protein